jgi:hypothetical protein
VTLSTVTSGGGAAFIQGNGFTLTNTNNTIQGDGIIGNGTLKVINQGTISANSTGGAQSNSLNLNGTGGLTNSGTLSVSASDFMHVSGGPFTNFAGATLTGGTYNVTGTLEIDELGSTGGEILTNAANVILNTPASGFIDAGDKNVLSKLNTNAAGSSLTITGGQNFTTAGNFTNNGTLTVGASTSKFDVNGNLTNFSGTTLTGGTYNVVGMLQFNGANIVTNAANVTLTGPSSQIINQSSANGLAHFATNASTGSFTLAQGRTLTTLGAFTNNGGLTMTGSGSKFTTGGTATFTNNGTLTTTGSDPSEVATGAGGAFTNHGTLNVGAGSKFFTGGSLSNFSGTTLTGGTYNVTGTLQFTGANIVTNAANITLSGASSQILNQTSGNGLANFATNSSTGIFSLQGGRTLTTVGNFSNAGAFTIGSGSTFTVDGTGTTFTQTAGSTLDDGTLALSGTGSLTLSGGSLLGTGRITGAVKSSATVSPGNSTTSTGILTETGAYTQNATGTLKISIGGTTAGTQYDQLKPGTATLGGALTTTLINGFTPTVGQSFTIMSFTLKTGTFASCDGRSGGTTCPINGTEHFNITYNPTSVALTVASGASIGSIRPVGMAAFALQTASLSGRSATGLLGTNTRAYPRRGGMNASELAVLVAAIHQNRLTGIAALSSPSAYGSAAVSRFAPAANTHAVHGGINHADGLLRNLGHSPRMVAPRIMEYHVNLLPILGASPKHALGNLAGQSGIASFFMQ